ncbi:hypothetical protein E2562_021530 [Oryza meyeriana var. granulata]|uniref:Uncharacterized protein n=1 Tax=Oryza meyeriana var. granulata TaxID=110450 RepID=A0A6G1DZK8_9ORYZ|nr:hypothetical protein E2562_021530 [Oryza meyeriana var. granulata]
MHFAVAGALGHCTKLGAAVTYEVGCGSVSAGAAVAGRRPWVVDHGGDRGSEGEAADGTPPEAVGAYPDASCPQRAVPAGSLRRKRRR